MIPGDLETDAASEQQKPSFLQSVFRSFARQNSRGGVGSGNRSRSNTGPGHAHLEHGTQSVVYSACLSSLSFFIHDGTVSTDESDDPYNAICFFHPPNYTPTEQWEFTGPVVGAVRFMTSFANSPPKVIHLSTSSIALMCFDNYTVALKASKVLCSSSLEACLRDLYNVFSLFFHDLQCVKNLCRDDDAEVALGRFKYNLAHIWTKLIGLVGPFKLFHPIAHIPHFVLTDDNENQLYQFFACIVAILSGFSRDTFGCLLSYNSQLVQTTFDVSLTRTLMLGSSLIRNMPQTARVLPPASRLPKGAFVRYAFVSRSQLLESRTKFRHLVKSLPLAAQPLLSRFDAALLDSAFSPQQQLEQDDGSVHSRSDNGSRTPNSIILARYFDFAWKMAGQTTGLEFRPSAASLDASFSMTLSNPGQENQLPIQETGDHWESRSSSMSSVAVNLHGVFQTPYSNVDKTGDEGRTANFDRMWADNATTSSSVQSPKRPVRKAVSDSSQDPFGRFNRLSQVLRSDGDDDRFKAKTFMTEEDKAFSVLPTTPEAGATVPNALVDAIRNAASSLIVASDEKASALNEATQNQPESVFSATDSTPFFSTTGLLDSGHSSVQFAFDEHRDKESDVDDHVSPTDEPSANNGRQTGDSGNSGDAKTKRSGSGLEGGEATDIIETCLYVQTHGPLSLIALLPNSPSLVKVESLRKVYEVLLQILADVCSLLMHLESISAAQQPNEAVVVSFEPSRQRLHRLGLCRDCNSDIRFDTQLFSVQRLFAKDSHIRDLQISDWTSHVRVTKEANPPLEETSSLSDSMAPIRPPNTPSQQQQQSFRHSYIKVKRNGCASSLIVLPSAE